MQQLSNLNEIKAECDRVVGGMLDGSMMRDDGLFAAATTLQRLTNEFTQFVTYALPILHTIDLAMRTAQTQQAQQAQQAQAQAQAQQAQAQQAQQTQAQQAQQAAPMQGAQNGDAPTNNVVPINTNDLQVVDATLVRRS